MVIYIYIYYNPPLGGAALISWRNEGTNAGTNLTTVHKATKKADIWWPEVKPNESNRAWTARKDREFPTWQSREGSWTAKLFSFLPKVFRTSFPMKKLPWRQGLVNLQLTDLAAKLWTFADLGGLRANHEKTHGVTRPGKHTKNYGKIHHF